MNRAVSLARAKKVVENLPAGRVRGAGIALDKAAQAIHRNSDNRDEDISYALE